MKCIAIPSKYSWVLKRHWCIFFVVIGGDEWKVVADLLGFNVDKIRFLDKRTCNPAEALLGYITHERFTVGVLYDLLNDCGLPVLADKLWKGNHEILLSAVFGKELHFSRRLQQRKRRKIGPFEV